VGMEVEVGVGTVVGTSKQAAVVVVGGEASGGEHVHDSECTHFFEK
jgi:hypothetical protein